MSEMVKFASQVDGEVLGKIRDIAKAEGRHLQMLYRRGPARPSRQENQGTGLGPRFWLRIALRSPNCMKVYRHLAK